MFSSLSPEKKIFVVIFWFVVGFFFPIHTNSVGDFWKSFDVHEDFHEPGCTLEGVCSTPCEHEVEVEVWSAVMGMTPFKSSAVVFTVSLC